VREARIRDAAFYKWDALRRAGDVGSPKAEGFLLRSA
jgi:hypothetical protein